MATPTVGKGGSHHIILKDLPSGGSTELGLEVVADAKAGVLEWTKRSLASFAQRRSTGPLEYEDITPAIELFHTQNDWSGGALQAVYDRAHPNRYASADGMDARWANVLTQGMKLNGPMGFLLRNPGADEGVTTDWTQGSGTTLSAETAAAQTGSHGFRLVTDGRRTNGAVLMSQTLTNPTVYQSRALKVGLSIKRTAGSESGIVVAIKDGTTAASSATKTSKTSAGAGATSGGAGNSWHNASNITASDDSDASIDLPSGYSSELLEATQFGFALPAGSVIVGIKVYVEKARSAGGTIKDVVVRLLKAGSNTGVSKADAGSDWPTSDTEVEYGGSSDLWGTTWTEAEIEASGFGVQISCTNDGAGSSTVSVDHIGIEVAYIDEASITDDVFVDHITDEFTIASGATTVTVEVRLVGLETGAHTFEVDDFYVIPTGGVVNNGFAEVSDERYGLFGRVVCQWDETNDVWDAVYVHASATATDIQEYNTNGYVAFGGGDNEYIYGTGTTWTVSTIAGDAKYAHFFTVSRQALHKTRFDGGGLHAYHATSTNPMDGGSWAAEDIVGSTDNLITGLYDFDDTVLIGKEDGLYSFLRVYNDGSSAALWQNVTRQFRMFIDPDNFALGEEVHGRFYTAATQQNLFRWDGSSPLEDITSLLFAPRLTDFGGKVRAMSFCATQLWLLADTPTTDTTTSKETWLLSLREEEGEFRLHTAEKVGIGDINTLAANNDFLWALGRKYNDGAADYVAAIYRWDLPDKTIAPAFDASPSLNPSASINMSRMDWGLPSEEKAFISLDLYLKDSVLDTEHSLVVTYKLDDGSAVTLGTINTSTSDNHHILYFNSVTNPETKAVGKAIELIFTTITDDPVSMEIYAYTLKATYQPKDREVHEYFVKVGDHLPLFSGGVDEDAKATKITDLETLRDKTWPIELTHNWDKGDTASTMRGHIERGSLRRVPAKEDGTNTEVWFFRFIEVQVAA